jgi:3'(2'), 5'-bisphosphate nucleotidase
MVAEGADVSCALTSWFKYRTDTDGLGMWTLDPIDGTKGFLRGEQYAVCLALIIDAQVELGVIGCPNLPVDPSNPNGARGCLFVAVRGQGSQQLTLSGSSPTSLSIPTITPSTLSFLESVESAHSSHSFSSRISKLLLVQKLPIRMDSQAKYCCLARGEGGAYLRMPTGVGYREKIWVNTLRSCTTFLFCFYVLPFRAALS